MSTFRNYLSLVKFSHTIFAMPFAFIGFFLGVRTTQAQGLHVGTGVLGLETDWLVKQFLLVVLCMVTARSAAMAFNRYLDRSFDAKNPRTAIREIPAGIISPDAALRFTIVNSLVFITASFLLHPLCGWLSPVALLVILGYSFTKRFTALCHLVLGLGLSLAPIGAYLAVVGEFHWLPIMFSAIVLCWVSGFDIIYALQDVDFDQSHGLHSIPSLLGRHRALRVSRVLHSMVVVLLLGVFFYGGLGYWYLAGVVFFVIMLLLQHRLVKPNDLSKVNLAFFTTNGIASVIFAVLVISDILF